MNLPNQPIQTYTYNELGEVIMKSLGYVNPTTWLQNVNFRYSIRGQLLNINNPACAGANDGGVTSNDSNDLFGMQMLYDGTDGNLNGGHGNTALFDGRPSAVKWMSTDASGNKSYERSYVYNYDGVARYTGEIYSERTVTGTGHFSNNVDGFDESGITYDQNGNILTLQRNSSTQSTNSYTQIDNLNYTYSTTQPNQVSTVTDGAGIQYTGAGFRNLTGSATPYVYDPNGNLTNDYYKGLQNGYNVLNRVDKCTVTTGTNQYINYIYDAGGNLIRKQEYNNNVLGTTTDYIGGFVYLTQGTGAAALSYFSRPEGRVLVNGSAFTQQFIITDGQGNARISFQNNGSSVAVVKQENSYYGFGLQLLNSPVSLPPKPNKQLYNGGSEWQNDYANGDTNLPDYYQTFNRNYDAAIGRFVGTDPYSESAESMTNYQYASNNPIMLNDPMGDKTVPGNTYNVNYVSPLSPQMGPLNNNWENSGGFDDNGPFSSDYGQGQIDVFGPLYSPDADGSYTTAWNKILSGTGYHVGSNGQAYSNVVGTVTVGPLTEGSGSGPGLNVIVYEAGKNPANHNYPGVNLAVGYISPGSSEYVGYAFLQTISEDGADMIIDDRGQDTGGLYYSPNDVSAVTQALAIRAALGDVENALFLDFPNGPALDYSFQAETTLVGVLPDGTIRSIQSFSWGYTLTNGVPATEGSSPVLINTPDSHQEIIEQFNLDEHTGHVQAVTIP